jgi:hypothetical protein
VLDDVDGFGFIPHWAWIGVRPGIIIWQLKLGSDSEHELVAFIFKLLVCPANKVAKR